MAWSGVAISAGVIFGPVIGSFLSQTDLHLEYSFGQLHLNQFSVPFVFVALLGLAVLLIIIKWLQDTTQNSQFKPKKITFHLSFSRYFIVLLLLSFVLQFVITLFETVFSIYGKDELAFNSIQVGIGFIFCGSVMAVLQPVFANYGEKILSAKNQIAIGFLISAISLNAFPFFKSEFVVYGIIIVFAVGGAMVMPNLLSAVSLISNENTGRNISLQSSTNSIGQILGPVLGTWLLAGGFYYPFIIAGSIVLVTIGFLFFLKNPNRHKNDHSRTLLIDN